MDEKEDSSINSETVKDFGEFGFIESLDLSELLENSNDALVALSGVIR